MYDCYFAGSGTKIVLDEMRKTGCNQLLSQLNERKAILDWVEYLKQHPECKSKLFIDSGAYSAHTKGVTVDVDEYIDFMNEIDDYVTIYAQVDTIPGRFGQPRTEKDIKEAPEKSWQNYLYMISKAKSPDKVLPVYHQGEDIKWLKNMLEFRHPDGHPIQYIGISSAKDQSVQSNFSWLKQVFKVIAESSNPNVKTHGFGIMVQNFIEQFPFTSSDSTTWIMAGANGNVMTKYGTVYISDRGLGKKDNYFNLSQASQDNLRKYFAEFGFTPEELSTDGDKRLLYHLRYLKRWQDTLEYKGNNMFKKTLINIGSKVDNNDNN